MAMADRRTEERTEISYALITNTDNKVEEKSFMKKIDKTYRKSRVCSPLRQAVCGQKKIQGWSAVFGPEKKNRKPRE